MAGAAPPLDVPLHAHSASWLNAVEDFFKLARRRLKCGVFRSVADPKAAINPLRPGNKDRAKARNLMWCRRG